MTQHNDTQQLLNAYKFPDFEAKQKNQPTFQLPIASVSFFFPLLLNLKSYFLVCTLKTLNRTAPYFENKNTLGRINRHMPQSKLRRRVPARGSRRSRPPHGHQSPSPRRRGPLRKSRPTKMLKRCASEPSLGIGKSHRDDADGDDHKRTIGFGYETEDFLFGPQACTDVSASSPSLMALSPPSGPEVQSQSTLKLSIFDVSKFGLSDLMINIHGFDTSV